MILENSFLNQQDHDIMKIKEKKDIIFMLIVKVFIKIWIIMQGDHKKYV